MLQDKVKYETFTRNVVILLTHLCNMLSMSILSIHFVHQIHHQSIIRFTAFIQDNDIIELILNSDAI